MELIILSRWPPCDTFSTHGFQVPTIVSVYSQIVILSMPPNVCRSAVTPILRYGHVCHICYKLNAIKAAGTGINKFSVHTTKQRNVLGFPTVNRDSLNGTRLARV
jgi:hypothetical protein